MHESRSGNLDGGRVVAVGVYRIEGIRIFGIYGVVLYLGFDVAVGKTKFDVAAPLEGVLPYQSKSAAYRHF